MDGDDLRRDVERLAQRLAIIEARLGITPVRARTDDLRSAVDKAPAAPERAANAPGFERPMVTAPPKIESPSESIARDKVDAFHRLHGSSQASAPPVSPASAPSSATTAPPTAPLIKPFPSQPQPAARRPSTSTPLEVLIGGKWMAWVGAIVVVLAAAFAVNVAIDRGWWGGLPEELRCLLIAAFGGLLLIGGELALRRIGKAASAGLFGAGLGTLYLDAFATFSEFELLSREWAFALMAAVAVGGFAITFRTRFLTIGVLSIIGGFLTPVLLRGASTHHLEFLSYLTMLLAISLALSAFLPRNFRPLRYIAMGGIAIVGLGWMLGQGAANWEIAIAFLSLWWAMILAETVFAALQRTSALGNAMATVLATAAYAGVGIQILNGGPTAGSHMLGGFALMIALLAAIAAFQFGPGIEALRQRPQTPIDKLAAALWIQSGALLIAAAALQFDGFGQTISWLAMGVAAIEIGRRLAARSVAVFGLVAGALGVVRVMLIDWWQSGMNSTMWSAGEVSISRWSLLMAAAILVSHVAAHRLPAQWRIMPVFLAVIGTFMWLLATAVQCDGLTGTAAWLIGALALLALEPISRRQKYLEIALLVLIAAAGKWLLFDALGPRLERGWTPGDVLPVLNWQMGLAAAIAAAGVWAFRIMRKRLLAGDQLARSGADPATLWQVVIIGGTVFMLIALSLETDRALERVAAAATAPLTWSIDHVRHLMLTLLWAIGATEMGVLAMALRQGRGPDETNPPRLLVQFCWALLIGCATKWIVFDTLYWSLFEGSRATFTSATPVANLQMMVGALLAIALMILLAVGSSALSITRDIGSRRDHIMRSPAAWMPVGAALLILWGLTFEVDRALTRAGPDLPMWLAIWPITLTRALLWTALWAVGGGAMIIIGRWRKLPALSIAGWSLGLICAAVWLTYDTLSWRFAEGIVAAPVVANLQFAVGLLLVVLLAVEAYALPRIIAAADADESNLRRARGYTLALLGAIVLWMGSLEIDRALMNQPMTMQTGLSVYWGLFAVALVLIGFMKRPGGIAGARYAGLALLSITALKVLFIDLAEVDNIARVISFLVSGLLLIATSIVYSRLAPKLLGRDEDVAQPMRSS